MTARTNESQDNHDRDEPPISLWNLLKNLTRLTEELAQDAAHAGNDNAGRGTHPPLAPRQYFEALLLQRRARERQVRDSLFSEPAWDIMLELMIARIDGRELRISELGANAAAGEQAHDHVDALVQARLVERFEDADPAQDCSLALSSEAARRMAELYRARMKG